MVAATDAASASPESPGESTRASGRAGRAASMPRCFHSSTASRQARSRSSSAAGVSPCRVDLRDPPGGRDQVADAATTVRGGPDGAGRSRRVTSVATPSVPSDPTNSPARSSPATPLVVRRQPDRLAVGHRAADHGAQPEHVVPGDPVLEAARPPALVATLPPIVDHGALAGSGGYHRPCSATAALRSLLTTPGCTTASRFSWSISRTRSIIDRSRMTQPLTASAPPDGPVPAPRGASGRPSRRCARRAAPGLPTAPRAGGGPARQAPIRAITNRQPARPGR